MFAQALYPIFPPCRQTTSNVCFEEQLLKRLRRQVELIRTKCPTDRPQSCSPLQSEDLGLPWVLLSRQEAVRMRRLYDVAGR